MKDYQYFTEITKEERKFFNALEKSSKLIGHIYSVYDDCTELDYVEDFCVYDTPLGVFGLSNYDHFIGFVDTISDLADIFGSDELERHHYYCEYATYTEKTSLTDQEKSDLFVKELDNQLHHNSYELRLFWQDIFFRYAKYVATDENNPEVTEEAYSDLYEYKGNYYYTGEVFSRLDDGLGYYLNSDESWHTGGEWY